MRSEIQSHPIQQCIQCIYTAYTHIHWIQPLKPVSIYLVVNFNSAQPSQNRDWGSSNLPTLAVLQYNFHFGRKSICPTRICKKKVDMIFGVPSALGFWCYLDLCQDIITVKGQICFSHGRTLWKATNLALAILTFWVVGGFYRESPNNLVSTR